MTDYREILRLHSLGLNNSQIAAAVPASRPTVIATLQRAEALGLDWMQAQALPDKVLAAGLFPPDTGKPHYKMPDYDVVHREMAKPGVTLQLLWFEYCDRCQAAGEIAYQLTQFKKYYREYALKTKATMHINRKPGELMEVDWAGQTDEIINDETGEAIKAYVFVSALPYSGYAYAEAFFNMLTESWIAAHVNAYAYFGGVTRILVPDNLKTGIEKNTRDDVLVNKTYQDMAEHYGTAVIPTRIRAPKDKASVEGTVGNVSSYILAAIRNQRFYSLRELNDTIHERLRAFNHKPFQKKDGSRASLFAQEKSFLLPLPKYSFEVAEWKVATVQLNYHIAVDGQYYSVPFEYLKRKVDVRLTRYVVEVFADGARLCSHARLFGSTGLYSTQDAHMPPKHQQYQQWTGERFRNWAVKIGQNAAAVVESILTSRQVEQQGYRACMSLLKLSEQYTSARLESACAKALRYTPRPTYKSVQTILKSGQDILPEESTPPSPKSPAGFTRGPKYYGKGRK
ncbi:integrase [Clostridia bacterium]|nr:integrase [Clostridia bacterium]